MVNQQSSSILLLFSQSWAAIIDTDPQCSLSSIIDKREERGIVNSCSFSTSFLKNITSEIKKYSTCDYIIVATQGAGGTELIPICKMVEAKVIVPMLPNFLDIEATAPLLDTLIEKQN